MQAKNRLLGDSWSISVAWTKH